VRRSFSNWNTPAVALGVIGVVIAAAAGAYAASGGGTITVCLHHRGGALYEASKCQKHDKKLRWNKQGPHGIQGNPGPQGIQGNQGPRGAAGPPGPTASGFAHSTGGTTISSSTDVIDLVSQPNTGSAESHTGAITVSFPARLIATGTISLRNGNASSEGVFCWLVLISQTGGMPFYYWGVPVTLGANVFYTPLAVSDGVDVAPGTYNVAVVCNAFGVANISTQAADLTVVATAR
jgi:hypothetical protein